MKKYILLLIAPFLFFSTGCEEDDILEEVTNTVIDENLIGEWKSDLTICDYYKRNFFDSGKCSFLYLNYWEILLNGVYECGNEEESDYWMSDYWIEQNYIVFEYDDGSVESLPYSVSGDELILGHPGEEYIYYRYPPW